MGLFVKSNWGGGLKTSFSTVILVSLYGLIFNTLNFVQTKSKDARTCMFGDECLYTHAVTWCCWRDIKMVHPTS